MRQIEGRRLVLVKGDYGGMVAFVKIILLNFGQLGIFIRLILIVDDFSSYAIVVIQKLSNMKNSNSTNFLNFNRNAPK